MNDTKQPQETTLPGNMEEHGRHYNEPDFWEKLQALPRGAIAQVLEKALLLRELLFDGATPLWVKGAIVGVLGYLILPFDLIPDILPGVGYVDDVAAMSLLLGSLDYLITEDIRQRVRAKLPDSLQASPSESES